MGDLLGCRSPFKVGTRDLHPGGLQPVQLLEEKILGFALMEIRVRGA